MSEYTRGQHPNNLMQKGNTLAQKGEAPLTRRVMIRLTEKQFQRLEYLVEEHNLSKADFFRKLLDEALPKQ